MDLSIIHDQNGPGILFRKVPHVRKESFKLLCVVWLLIFICFWFAHRVVKVRLLTGYRSLNRYSLPSRRWEPQVERLVLEHPCLLVVVSPVVHSTLIDEYELVSSNPVVCYLNGKHLLQYLQFLIGVFARYLVLLSPVRTSFLFSIPTAQSLARNVYLEVILDLLGPLSEVELGPFGQYLKQFLFVSVQP